jgi:hypothetical protein
MRQYSYCLTMLILIICISLNAEAPLIIRENTNFAYESNSVALQDGVVSVWADTKSSLWKLYAQKVDTNGNMLWNNYEPLLIDENLSNSFPYIDIIITSDNCIITSWIGHSTSNIYRLYAQKISSDGEIMWSQENETIAELTDTTYHTYLAANDIGGAYLFYDYGDQEVFGFNLDSDANDLWANNPSPFITEAYLFEVLSDNTGGIVLFYEATSGDNNITATRVDFNQVILWEQIVTNSGFTYPEVNVVPVGSNDFVICWSYFYSLVYGQRLDLEGNVYWGAAGMELTDEVFPENHKAALAANDNNFYIVYSIPSTVPNEYTFKIKKVDLNGNSMWENETILANSNSWIFDAQTNENQGCYILWYWNAELVVQNIDSAGNKLWGDDGIAIGSNYSSVWTQYGARINVLNSNSLFTWQLIKNGKSFLRYQSIDYAGNTLLPEDGVILKSGMQSAVNNWQLVANDNSFYYLWQDYRFSQSRIFAQRVFPNGNACFPQNGIALTDTSFSNQNYLVCKSLPEGGIVSAWSEIKENEEFYRVRLQILYPDGSLFSPNGIDLTSVVVENQIEPQIDIVDGNIIIIWLENGQIKTQKLVDFMPVWGNNGSLLVSNGDTGFAFLTGNYIYFDYQDESYFNQIDESGYLNANWPYPGVGIPEDTNFPKTINTSNNDLVYTWRDSYSGIEDYGFQILESSGNYVFPGNGFNMLNDVDFSRYNFLYDDYINLYHSAESGLNILMERYDLQGQMIWDGSFCYLQNNNGYNYLHSAKMGDKFLVVWYAYNIDLPRTYLAQLIDADGVPIPSTLTGDEYQIFSSHCDYQLATATDNDVAILFERGYVVGSDSEFFPNGLVTFLISTNDVHSIPDEIVTSPKCALSNYPNPFNPETKISFSISVDSKVELSIYNMKGQKVKDLSPSLCHPEFIEGRGENEYSVIWNGTDDNNKPVSSGIYFYKLKSDDFEKTNKMLLIK